MKDKLVHGSMQVCIFLLRGAGWVAVGVFVGFIVSNFFRLPGRFDTFAFAETMLGVVITGLAIVGAFMVALQWSNLDSKIHAFDIKVKETNEFFDKQAERMQKVAQDTDKYVQSTIDDYNEKVNSIYKHFEDEIKIADEINSKVDEYKKFYGELFIKSQNQFEEKDRALEERQKELSEMVKEYGKLLDRVDKALELRTDGKQSDIEEAATNGL